jgi:hypothetical protein
MAREDVRSKRLRLGQEDPSGDIELAILLPSGHRVCRKFLKESKISALYDFAEVKSVELAKSPLVSSFALVSDRKRLLECRGETLKEIGLQHRTTLLVQAE